MEGRVFRNRGFDFVVRDAPVKDQRHDDRRCDGIDDHATCDLKSRVPIRAWIPAACTE
jgi:hypothetical protein